MAYNKKVLGKIGEDLACMYLENINYTIVYRNFRCKQGEIDIIARDNNELVFIEVKTRTNKRYGKPVEAVTNVKQKHIKIATEYYLYKKHIKNEYIRLDVIEVYIDERHYKINHIKQIM